MSLRLPRENTRTMNIEKQEKADSLEDLRELARRARFLASNLSEPDKSRIEAYAAKLERLAEQKERPD